MSKQQEKPTLDPNRPLKMIDEAKGLMRTRRIHMGDEIFLVSGAHAPGRRFQLRRIDRVRDDDKEVENRHLSEDEVEKLRSSMETSLRDRKR